jgi:hypothetical protein
MIVLKGVIAVQKDRTQQRLFVKSAVRSGEKSTKAAETTDYAPQKQKV